MILISDKLFMDVKIDGNPIPDSFNLIQTVSLTEGNGTLFPACKIVFNDLSGNLTDSLNLTDGNSISITVGKSVDDVSTVTRQYRVFGMRQSISPAGPQMTVVCIYDAPAFTTANVREGFAGTSTQVMEKIADECKLIYDGPTGSTNDNQNWLNVCRNRATFVQDLARHGYIDAHSGMACALTSLGVLKYKNLLYLMEKTPRFTLYHNVPQGEQKDTEYLVRQARDSSQAGMMNSWQNYGSTKVVHSLSGVDTLEEKLEVKTSGKYLPINQQVSDTVKRARVDHSPLDCSNVHRMYERALYQNVKLLGLFVEKVSVLVTVATDIQLFDTVYYRQADSDITKPAEPSDIYLVVGKSVHVKGSQTYAERLEIVRMSVNNKGKAALETQDPTSLRDSSIPESYTNPTIFTAANTASIVALVAGIFSTISNPTRTAYGALSQLGNLTQASSVQLGNLVNMLGGTGITNNPKTVVTTLQLLNNPASLLSNSISNIAASYVNIDNNLGTAMKQVEQLPPAQQATISRAGLQQASLFNPAGAVTSLAVALPILKSLSQMSSAYSSVNRDLTKHSAELIKANPDAAQHIAAFGEHSANITTQYESLSTSTNSIWNKVISITNNKPIPVDLYNYTKNTQTLDDLADTSLEVPPGQRYKVTQLNSTVNSMSGIFQSLDASRKLLWMYPAFPISKTNRYSSAELPGALATMNNNASMLGLITRENTLG
jgi:hypothetical protein